MFEIHLYFEKCTGRYFKVRDDDIYLVFVIKFKHKIFIFVFVKKMKTYHEYFFCVNRYTDETDFAATFGYIDTLEFEFENPGTLL